ncbi:hypothetical protein GCM10009751_38580 [Myceligenerans crystallogenes]|uniref:DUF4276 family protein n=2 Tax=Myceligenerans crystallogenes TaxID=316335 RepID=A0ABN2NM20_9MICO
MMLREGTSDDGLLRVIEDVIVQAGADATGFTAITKSLPVEHKIRDALADGGTFDLLFVHRDSDSPDPDDRLREVRDALDRCGVRGVAIVPVQMTEAWLLTSESDIRQVCGRPSGREPLGLPSLRNIESTRNPKDVLRDAMRTASNNTGRRRQNDNREFGRRRRLLLERLDVDGRVRELPSFQRFVSDTEKAVQEVLSNRTAS